MTIDNKLPQWRHQVVLVDREELSVDGVTSLGSYDEHQISMETELGLLVIKGEGLNIQSLNLERGNIVIDGNVKNVGYEDEQKQKKGLLNRLLR